MSKCVSPTRQLFAQNLDSNPRISIPYHLSDSLRTAISQALAGIEGVINISDDILIFGTTQAAHDKALQMVFERLSKTGLTLNKVKCAYNKSIKKFFGLIFSADGDPKKVEAIANAPCPK